MPNSQFMAKFFWHLRTVRLPQHTEQGTLSWPQPQVSRTKKCCARSILAPKRLDAQDEQTAETLWWERPQRAILALTLHSCHKSSRLLKVRRERKKKPPVMRGESGSSLPFNTCRHVSLYTGRCCWECVGPCLVWGWLVLSCR